MNWLGRRLAPAFGRWPIALATVALLAIVCLMPALGTGFWEPQERALADKAAPRAELEAKHKADEASMKERDDKARAAAIKADPSKAFDTCLHVAPPDPLARSLATRAPAFGRDAIDDSDAGRRLPYAILGFLTVLAIAGIAMRTAGGRAGVIAGIVALSFPLLALQARQLTSEIGTPCGAALIIYGLVALGRSTGVRGWIEAIVSLLAIVAGVTLGFLSGGALLGVLVPFGAFAVAGGLGVPALASLGRLLGGGALHLAGKRKAEWLRRLVVGRSRERGLPVAVAHPGDRRVEPRPVELGEQLKVLIATLATIAVIAALAYQLYDIHRPYPGAVPAGRSIAGHVIAPTNCWSSVLGGIWKPDDDLRMIYDSTFEQIAYGTFPWGIAGPIAIAALLAAADSKRKRLGAITLAWAGASWLASEAFQRKVGFTIWAGFPALAVAIGVWLDGVLAARRAKEPVAEHGGRLIAVFVGLAILDLGKDLQSFSEKLTSLVVGGDAIAYPTQSHVLGVQTRLWVFILGIALALAFGIAMSIWSPKVPRLRRAATLAAAATFALTIVFAAFWPLVWQPVLGQNLSSEPMFETWRDLHGPNDQLVVMGDLGDAPHDYAASPFEQVSSRDQIVSALGRPGRVFAVAPQSELCTLHRELAGKPYYVVDDRDVRSLLLSNKVDGTTDKNPLKDAIVHSEPTGFTQKPKGRVVWEGKIQLLGWEIPLSAKSGAEITVKLYYKILQPVPGVWTTLMHFDGPLRFNGDHKPINDRCPTSTWQPGDFIVDTFTFVAGGGGVPRGTYDLWTGFFTGTNPNWKNMPLTEAPGDIRDTTDRVKLMQFTLE